MIKLLNSLLKTGKQQYKLLNIFNVSETFHLNLHKNPVTQVFLFLFYRGGHLFSVRLNNFSRMLWLISGTKAHIFCTILD